MISVIFLLEDQQEDFPDFLINLDRIFSRLGTSYELVVVANGTGNFFRTIQSRLNNLNHTLRAFEFGAQVTQATALKAILNEAQGDILAIFGSYQQITDESLAQCIQSMDDTADVVSPFRQQRVDPSFNQFQSRVFNALVKALIRTDIHDFSCTVKICRRSVLEGIDLYGNMFRFFPVLAAAKGFRINEVKVEHLQERGKAGFYSLSEYITRILDIFTLFFNTRFSRKPLRFFSTVGVGFIMLGLVLLTIIVIQRLYFSILIGDRPLLFVSLLFMFLGVIVSSAGLLGEIIAFTNGRHKKEYMIEKVI